MLFDTETTTLIAHRRLENGLCLLLAWGAQIFSITWSFIQPIRSLAALVTFTLIYLLLLILPTVTYTKALKRRQQLTADLATIYLLFVETFLLLPQAFTRQAFFTDSGVASVFTALIGLGLLYLPEHSDAYIQLFPLPHHTRFLKRRYRRALMLVFLMFSLLWLLTTGLNNGVNF